MLGPSRPIEPPDAIVHMAANKRNGRERNRMRPLVSWKTPMYSSVVSGTRSLDRSSNSADAIRPTIGSAIIHQLLDVAILPQVAELMIASTPATTRPVAPPTMTARRIVTRNRFRSEAATGLIWRKRLGGPL